MNVSGLRIVMVTPWNIHSAIAGVNLLVARELVNRGSSVLIVRSEVDADLERPAVGAKLTILQASDFLQLRPGYDYDVVCYSFGNYYGFHALAPELLAQRPGIVLLHDASLRELAAEWKHRFGNDAYSDLLSTQADRTFAKGDAQSTAETVSMVEWPMSMATAGVVHAQHYRDLAAASCPGPVVELPLPVADVALAPPRKRLPGDPIEIVTVGHVNGNKLPEDVIRAIGSLDSLRTSCRYRLLGPITDEMRSRIENLANGLGVKIEVTGWLEERHLHDALGMADCVMCLRYPILEGASMSAIVGMLSARPTVVCDAGFYSEIPDDLVLKLTSQPDITSIADALAKVLEEPEPMAAMAARARIYALETFTASRYAAGLLDLVERAIDVHFTVSEARGLHAETHTWGVDGSDPLFSRLAHVSAGLFS